MEGLYKRMDFLSTHAWVMNGLGLGWMVNVFETFH